MSESDDAASGSSPFGIPGTAGMQDMFQAMQQSWNMPGMSQLAPTLDPEELDKRIADLNTVAQWLALNQNMLQTTIQTLQIQRATLHTLRSFGDSMPGSAFSGAGAAGTQSAAYRGADADPATRRSTFAGEGDDDGANGPAGAGPRNPDIDPQQWWADLRSQFDEIARTALAAMTPSADPPAKRRSKAAGGSAAGRGGRASAATAKSPRASKTARKRKPPAGTDRR